MVSAAILEIGFSSPFHSYIRFGKRFSSPCPTLSPFYPSITPSRPLRARVSFMTYSSRCEPPYLRCFRSNTPTSLRNIAKRFFHPRCPSLSFRRPPAPATPVLYRFGPFRRICNITLSLWPLWQAAGRLASPSEILIIKSTEPPADPCGPPPLFPLLPVWVGVRVSEKER